jgi:hypothetical protein
MIKNSTYLLQRCELIADISALMLAAAGEGDWREVDRLKAQAAAAIGEVRVLSAIIPLSAEERLAKLASMKRILANDGQIQMHAQPWLTRLARWLPAGGAAKANFSGMLR